MNHEAQLFQKAGVQWQMIQSVKTNPHVQCVLIVNTCFAVKQSSTKALNIGGPKKRGMLVHI